MFELQRRKIPPSFPSEIRRVQQRCRSGPPPTAESIRPSEPRPGDPHPIQPESSKTKEVKEYWDINGNSRNHWPCRLQAILLPVSIFKINDRQDSNVCSKMFLLKNTFLKKNLFIRKLKNMLKATLEMFREYQLGMMTFPFLQRIRVNGEKQKCFY